MKHWLSFAAAAAALASLAPAAHAQTATQDINISATVTKACTIANVPAGTAGSATIPVSAAGAVNTAAITPTGSPFANVACNAPATLQLTSLNGAVTNVTPAASGFTNFINYSASATWNSVTASVNTATVATATGAESGTGQAVTANSGNLDVTITPQATSLPLITGAYSDTLRVTLTPQ